VRIRSALGKLSDAQKARHPIQPFPHKVNVFIQVQIQGCILPSGTTNSARGNSKHFRNTR
jgi:hypothetical protein